MRSRLVRVDGPVASLDGPLVAKCEGALRRSGCMVVQNLRHSGKGSWFGPARKRPFTEAPQSRRL